MPEKSAQFLRATPVLRVANYPKARAYYVDKLGFQVAEEGGDPARFGIIQRGRCILFLDSWHEGKESSGQVWDAYIHVSNLQELFKEFESAGATIARPITKTVYDMLEFEITDPDGNRLCFGEDTDPATCS
ncbi:glyoxalase superfamily protein [Candidatus Nitronereus thalassa]|uniref:Glyoxalase superfamily protein n=1 Tax=Candidatus Nitronereus thalassa TaxID=3020898 RepID=A0ABU3KCL2_9BACT|nr:glyoxalase superfamily protein [Candidatus Nitronereus thalassa]MDT7044038.1 glyoxalase superfamily protein [Candidatus Nitronereus thalassa]